MVMAEYFTHDRLQELWHQIHHLHLTYLDTEDSPQKIEQRTKLEACIREYLYIAPHNRKFCCSETAEVLHRSASSKKDFSGYRAALAWNAVSMYAGNLLSQPWRKEYRQIKMYCGFYKHQIEANLVGAEAMFEAMGYKHAGDGILILEGPVCPDRVSNVSQDSIVAFVECQILKTIWEEISNNFKVSWLDVLEFRESHLCSPEQSIRMLNFRLHERRYQEQHNNYASQGNDTYSTLLRYSVPQNAHPPPAQHVATHTPTVPATMHTYASPAAHHTHHAHHYPTMPAHMQPSPVQCQGQCMYALNPYYNYSTYAPAAVPSPYPRYGAVPYHPVPLTCPPKQPCNGYCYPNGCVPPSAYMCPVPTGQLIELDNAQNGMYDVVDTAAAAKRQQDQLESHKQLAKSTNLDSLTLSKSKEDGAGTFESWDYVYRNLESQGYSKDLGERPDVLQPPSEPRKRQSVRDSKKAKLPMEIIDEFNNLNINAGASNQTETLPLKINEALKRFKDTEVPHNTKLDDSARVAPSSSYDNISSQDSYNNKQTVKAVSNGIGKSVKTLPRERVALVSPDKPNYVATLDTRKLRKQDVDKIKPKETKPKEKTAKVGDKENASSWNCKTCTYLNNPTVEICVICGKSKKAVEVVMAVGGSQCPTCTLVNPKDIYNCQACDTSLLNSPTYI